MTLDPIQLRVLGSLIEKEIATPENYPLSLNSLANACNQKSSRDPVLTLTEAEVRQALHTLEDLALVAPVHDGRVPKYEHRIRTVLNLRRDETAALCLLMLRGPQTPGEIRSRADRLYTFDDLAAVQATLDRLAARNRGEEDPAQTGPLTVQLPRQPGSRESRYSHLLGALPEIPQSHAAKAPSFSLVPIGYVESPLKERTNAPRQGSDGAPEAWVVINPDVQQGLSKIAAGQQIVLLTWFHQASRDVLEVHPGWNPDMPLTGVFAARSPDRPNPIGLHRVEVLEISGNRLRVAALEAIDGTPVIDIKPVLVQSADF
ncbi:tRNA (N6-threonylcarbamoyladenosine(37)-N6)-methyltransferase TrmO [Edaphobacter sp.]|uniref:tRNA (N6-threonylcarbamoyladenosine(37)-N6)-methyltransferase TrmO n=1 Tax=Edaphobacter sp. TaxID=1934404 RepID=UPI002DBACC3D|nr:tRNA (N6-threonylcarbamoyladenosine(37)-N6)-methyltransferase TrmO [Edaphobacter sp.]HEU5340011.1 tRNA (N6-threonylcarbamoyladenosine(37)-N6)-methyltransferase TrmO [Edaphobacter sp.]